MKTAFITPHYRPFTRGNGITVRRIARRLRDLGVETAVFALDEEGDLEKRLAELRPDVIHALHGTRGGSAALALSRETGLPYIVTLTGTDIFDDDGRIALGEVVGNAAGVAVFTSVVAQRVEALFPSAAEKVRVVPQGVEVPPECPGCGFPFARGNFHFFLPAGLRPVKDVLFALAPLARLYQEDAAVRFVIAGPILDAGYATDALQRLEEFPFASYLGGVGHASMGCLYNKSDIVLNTSVAEGGMPNSVLEAMALGRPVLAANIDGNRGLVADGVTGLLYRGEDDFIDKARLLRRDPALRALLGERARAYVLENFPPELEAQRYLEMYRQALG